MHARVRIINNLRFLPRAQTISDSFHAQREDEICDAKSRSSSSIGNNTKNTKQKTDQTFEYEILYRGAILISRYP